MPERLRADQQPAEPPGWSAVLRALCGAAGVTQEGWAAQLGLGRRTVQRWEHGELPPDATGEAALVALCRTKGLFRSYTAGPLAGGRSPRSASRRCWQTHG
jgi:hypothetical protein